MNKQLFWEDVVEGQEIPPLSKIATTAMLVRWAGGSGDFNPLHYDRVFAESAGVGQPIVHGALKRQWLIQLMTDWIGDLGWLKSFSCQYRAMDIPRAMRTMTEPVDGEIWLCKGKITKKYIDGDAHCVDCDIRIENGKGEITTPGKATVILPIRGESAQGEPVRSQ